MKFIGKKVKTVVELSGIDKKGKRLYLGGFEGEESVDEQMIKERAVLSGCSRIVKKTTQTTFEEYVVEVPQKFNMLKEPFMCEFCALHEVEDDGSICEDCIEERENRREQRGSQDKGMMFLTEHVLFVAEQHKKSINNLQLQKVLYFVLGKHIKKNGIDRLIKETYDLPFAKWRYGPAVEDIYRMFQLRGRINLASGEIIVKRKYHECYAQWTPVILELLNEDLGTIVRKSQCTPTYRRDVEQILIGKLVGDYSLDDLLNDFSPREENQKELETECQN